MCADTRPGGEPCRRTAVAAVTGGDVVALLCAEDTVRALARIAGLQVRFLADRERASGRPA